jgi:DNA modification methylase
VLADSTDYKERTYLSAIETAKYLDITVKELHRLTRQGEVHAELSASGQKRYDLGEIQNLQANLLIKKKPSQKFEKENILKIKNTTQNIYIADSKNMTELKDGSIHLMVTSPPYFNAKMYSQEAIEHDLGNIHDLDEWFNEIGKVWGEVFRVLQPGRKAFINIMNLPIRTEKTFRTLNLVGRTVDVCEELGFIFKRDIIWQKTNGVKAHFGTYPYPGGILLNHMHEFILEFEKPNQPGGQKYGHVTQKQKERSKLDKEFWLSLKNSDVWLMKPENSGDGRSHVAPFPDELPYRIIKAYSYLGERVLDPFMGSGTVLKVAAGLGRNGVGYEINPKIARDAMDAIKHIK